MNGSEHKLSDDMFTREENASKSVSDPKMHSVYLNNEGHHVIFLKSFQIAKITDVVFSG